MKRFLDTKYLLGFSIGLLILMCVYIWTQTLTESQGLDLEAFIVLTVLGFIFGIAIIAFGVWCYAAYKWITRKKWQNNKTRKGNRRV